MSHPIELLEDLEKVEQRNESHRRYVQSKAGEVQAYISRLRVFADHKPGPVAEACKQRANSLQHRLDKILV